MVKRAKQATVNSLAAFMDGLNVNDEPEHPKNNSVDSLLGDLKKLKVTPGTGKTGFKKAKKSETKKSESKKSGIPKYHRMPEDKRKKVFKRRTLSARNAGDKLSEAMKKLGLGTKKKRKRRRSKTKRN